MGNIAFATCKDLGRFFKSRKNPLLTHDDQVAADALAARGHRVEPLVWGCEPAHIRDRGFDLVIIRSCWDYMDTEENRRGFVDWLRSCDQAGTVMENPVGLMLWNMDKHYLADLKKAEVPVVPTTFLPDFGNVDLEGLYDALGPFVLKPCVSAGAVDAFLLKDKASCQGFDFHKQHAGRDFMAQPFVTEVLGEGEWSLVFVDGRFVHAVNKRPRPGDWRVQDEWGGSVRSLQAPAAMITVAHQAMRSLPVKPLYARVDLLREHDPLVGELELIEPELFFLERSNAQARPHPPTIEAFCAAVESRLGKGSS